MQLLAIPWNVDPEIISLGKLSIRYYGLFFATGFVLGYFIFTKIFKNEGISVEVLDKLTIYMVVGTVIGARLGHVLFYQPEFYLEHPLEILAIWHGGLASHGAAIGIIITLYIFSKKQKKPFIWILDRIVIAVALAGFFIRMGNLMNSEIYGTTTNLPWGFIFLREGETVPKHPTQIYEALAYLFIFFFLFSHYFRNKGKIRPGFLFSMFLILVFSARFFIEFLKEVQVGWEKGMALNMGQILSLPFIALGLYILFRSLKRKPEEINSATKKKSSA
jgi:prolipoprotein diacylglyceryl transferase